MLQSFLTGFQGPLHRGYNVYYGNTRVIGYARAKRVYDGWVMKNTSDVVQWKKLRFNVSQPIVNINAAFLAGKPIRLQVDGNPELTEAANGIWDRSGGFYAFLENAILGLIYGDSVLIPNYDKRRKAWRLKWVDASIVYPVFDPADYDKIKSVDFVWADSDESGQLTGWYREHWCDGVVTRYDNGEPNGTIIDYYDNEIFEGCPIAWIKNDGIKGEPFGRSLITSLIELTEEYDHLMTKNTSIIDYYASPNLAFIGTKKTDNVDVGLRKIFFLPEGGDVKMVEWSGSPPGIQEHLARVKNMISEVSATPNIAFSNFDFKFSDVSGVALKVLFGPLLLKTDRARIHWGKGITRAVRMALYYETGQLVEEDQITILWPNPLPNNTKEDWEISAIKNLLGVPQVQIHQEQGYTADQIETMEEEMAEEREELVRIQALSAQMLAEATAEGQVEGVRAGGGGGGGRLPMGAPNMSTASGKRQAGKQAPTLREFVDQKSTITPGKIQDQASD